MELKHRAKLGLGEEATPKGCKGSERAGTEAPEAAGASKKRKKAKQEEFEQPRGLDSETSLQGSNGTCIWLFSPNHFSNLRERRASTVGKETKRRLAWVLQTCGSAFLVSLLPPEQNFPKAD